MAAVGAFTSMDQAEDLKAFERRLVEYVNDLGPTANKWRMCLFVACILTASTAWNWALDHHTTEVAFFQSLVNHKLFAISCIMLVSLLLLGTHKRIMVKSIMLGRSKDILEDFNMSCDEIGRLILKPRPKELDVYERLFIPSRSRLNNTQAYISTNG